MLEQLWLLECAGPEFRPREHLWALPSSEPDPLQCPQPALGVLPWVFKSVSPSLETPGPDDALRFWPIYFSNPGLHQFITLNFL